MAVKKKSSGSKTVFGVIKMMFKAVLTGCLFEPTVDDLDKSNPRYSQLIQDNDRKNSAANNNGRKKGCKGCNEVDLGRWSHLDEDSDCCCNSSDKKEKNMFSLQNCTLQSKVQGNGESYWVSFEEKSFSKGHDFKVYSGRMNGTGPKSGDKCVVKVFRQCKGTEQLCLCEVKKSHKAKIVAKEFNRVIRDKKVRIKMATVYWAHIDEVSSLKMLLFSGVRKLRCGEAVLFEDDVRINEDKPGKSRKLTTFMDSQGLPKKCKAKVLEAFAHFTYHNSNGQFVICGLDGVQDDDGFFLKTPTIHSRAREYGSTDNGEQGISDVFSNHVCNEICSHMIKPVFNDDQVSAINCGVRQNCSTPQHASTRLDLQRQESRISQYSANVSRDLSHPCPFLWQDSKVSQDTDTTPDYCHRATALKSQESEISRLSQVACCSEHPLEPTAPLEERDDIYLPKPPPYSERFVANWILGEQAPNSFIPPVQDDLAFLAKPDSFVCTATIEQGPMVRKETNLNERSRDVNANICDDTSVDTSAASTTGFYDETQSQASVVCSPFHKKQVRFSHSTETTVSTVTRVSTEPMSAASDGPMETSTFASEASSPRVFPRSILRRDSTISSQHSNQFNPLHVNPSPAPFQIPCVRPVLQRQDNIMSIRCSSDRANGMGGPPTYDDSEFTTAFWVIGQGYIQLATLTNFSENNNNDQQQIANTTTARTHSSGLPITCNPIRRSS